MCEKCVRKAKRLGHKPLSYGQVKYFARDADIALFSVQGMGIYRATPLFKNRGINYAVEAHRYKIHRKKTNKKIYNRKKLDPVV